MKNNLAKNSGRLGAVFYILWGLVHILAGLSNFQLGSQQSVGEIQGRLFQNGWNLLFIALASILIAGILNWKNSRLGYWLNLLLVSISDVGFILFLLIPGYSKDLVGPILWILGALFSTIGILKGSSENHIAGS